jgi:hypothetical protein
MDTTEELPEYVSMTVGARLARVHYSTFKRYAKPSAWSRDRTGRRIPLYDADAVFKILEQFNTIEELPFEAAIGSGE